MKRALLLTCLLAGCRSGTSAPAAPEVLMNESPTPSLSGRCTTEAEVRAKLGATCTVVGTYELREIASKKGEHWRNWPVVTLDGGGFVALESVWFDDKLPAPAEIERWRGKTVAVTGTLLGEPPLPPKQKVNMSMLTLAPVESIEAVE